MGDQKPTNKKPEGKMAPRNTAKKKAENQKKIWRNLPKELKRDRKNRTKMVGPPAIQSRVR